MKLKVFLVMAVAISLGACASSSGSTGGGSTSGGTDATVASDSGNSAADTAKAGGDAAAGTDTTAGTADTATGGSDTAAAADTGAATGGTWAEAAPGFKAKCGVCHTAAAKNVFVAEDCASAAAKATLIKGDVETGKMPQKGMPALSDGEKKAILDWVAAGAKCP